MLNTYELLFHVKTWRETRCTLLKASCSEGVNYPMSTYMGRPGKGHQTGDSFNWLCQSNHRLEDERSK